MKAIELVIETLGGMSLEELLEMYRHAEFNTLAEENLLRLLIVAELDKRIEIKKG